MSQGGDVPPHPPTFLMLDEKLSLVSFPCEQRLYLKDPQLKPVQITTICGEHLVPGVLQMHLRGPAERPRQPVELAPIYPLMPS